ncbi:hypothetical protein Tco_0285761 [Tanacetum coccineum]
MWIYSRETVGGSSSATVWDYSGLNCKEYDTDEVIDEQELKQHYVHGNDSKDGSSLQTQAQTLAEAIGIVETGDSNVIPDSPDMCDNDIQDDQNNVECDDERVALDNLIANLKLMSDDNKKIPKSNKKANATLTQELNEWQNLFLRVKLVVSRGI